MADKECPTNIDIVMIIGEYLTPPIDVQNMNIGVTQGILGTNAQQRKLTLKLSVVRTMNIIQTN